MILCGDSIRDRQGMITPFNERTVYAGMSYGLSVAGYDIRIHGSFSLDPGDFILASSMEKFDMPLDLLARVTDKSTWARKGLCVQNTVIEPGWRGYLTLELTNHGHDKVIIWGASPIAQILFEKLDYPVSRGYDGKYQNQPMGAISAKYEE